MPKKTFERRLEALAALQEPNRLKLYEYVASQPEPVGRDAAAAAVGVSRTVAAFHLDKLVDLGLLTAGYRRLSGRTGPGAGRPSKLYQRSRRRFEISVPERNHALLARLLAPAASRQPSGALDAGKGYGFSVGGRARTRIPRRRTPEHEWRCITEVLRELGFEPFHDAEGELRARNCPFHPVSQRFTDVVCPTAVAVVEGVIEGIGAESLRAGRREPSDGCCVTVISTPLS